MLEELAPQSAGHMEMCVSGKVAGGRWKVRDWRSAVREECLVCTEQKAWGLQPASQVPSTVRPEMVAGAGSGSCLVATSSLS